MKTALRRFGTAAVEQIRYRRAGLTIARACGAGSPFLIYSQPKTGTTSLDSALVRAGLVVPKIHFLRDSHDSAVARHAALGRPLPLHHFLEDQVAALLRSGEHFRIVCLVREPVARQVSSLFQAPWLFGADTADVEETCRAILAGLQETAASGSALSWFRREITATFDFDIPGGSFDIDAGWGRYAARRGEVLLLKTEALDQLGPVVSDFVGRPLAIERLNVRNETRAARHYNAMRQRLKIPQDMLAAIYGDPLMQVFYGPSEIDAFVRRWLGE